MRSWQGTTACKACEKHLLYPGLSIWTGSSQQVSFKLSVVPPRHPMGQGVSATLPYLQSAKHPFRPEQLLTSAQFGWVQDEDFKAESNIISKFMSNPSSRKSTNILPEKWKLLPES